MKKIMMLLVVFYAFTTLYGQGFASIGTKWQYDYHGVGGVGNFVFESVSDTVIQGKKCRKVVAFQKRFFYENKDTLFEMREGYNAYFAPVFRYNLQVGDTLLNPYNGKDNSYKVIRQVYTLISGQKLNQWQLKVLCQNPRYFAPVVTFIEKIGSSDGDITLNFTCFSDPTGYTLCKFSSGNIKIDKDCLFTKAHDLPANIPLSIYPNPATVSLSIATEHSFVSYKIYDINGKILQKNTFSNGVSIDVSMLDNGIYFLWLIDKDKLSAYRRFVLHNK
jgi:Secretion system C-terminal sorting domain